MTRLVEIATFYDPEEALCAQGAVRAGGCFSFLQNQYHLGTAPSLRVALGGYRLFVLEDDEERALLSLGKSLNDGSAAAPETPQEATAPADQIRVRKNWLWLPVALTASVPFVPTYKNSGSLLFQLIVSIPFYLIIAFALMQ